MNFGFLKYIGPLTVVLALASLAACTLQQASPQGQPRFIPASIAVNLGPPSAIRREKHLINGIDPDAAMHNQASLEQTLAEFGVMKPGGGTALAWINKIAAERNKGKMGPAVFKGIGGLPARSLLEVARATVNPNPGSGNFADRPGVETYGNIEAVCDGLSGYFYDEVTKNGRLCVTMITTTTRGFSSVRHSEAYRFLVTITGGFEREPKKFLDANNVFPDAQAATGIMINSATATGFNYKLYAKGESIEITKVWHNKNYDEKPEDFEFLDPDEKKHEALYETDNSACIDMMFATTPPRNYADLSAPPFYCLGRCGSPMIINTR